MEERKGRSQVGIVGEIRNGIDQWNVAWIEQMKDA
jgi:hypothetical protein